MSLKSKLKRAIRFILSNIPARKYDVRIVNLAPNELLKGRAALITGGTSGIGYCMAETFLRSGAIVVITSRNKDRLNKSLSELNKSNLYSNRVFGVVMDNANISSFQGCLDKVLDCVKTGGGTYLDILVNNAGVIGGNMPNACEKDYDTVLDTNLKGVFFLSQLMGKYMKENKIEGNILNVASSSSLRPADSAYSISKWGVRGLTLGLAKSLVSYGITVNGIAPGPTATSMLVKDNLKYITNNSSPIGRYILPEEIANMALFLVSSLGKTIIGDIIYMTGGAATITYDDVNCSF